ncbi:chymotrypsin-like elastase family member 2A [Arctopsyche grandis]|uniref:chymotrypsin-like elastase family member 2A n=1 Tax=Arctopsyche grandis TaxID=121162 RepID=UPI00406D64F5
MIRVLVVLFILTFTNCSSEVTDAIETYQFYPCIDVDSVLETFSFSSPRSYNITVFISKLENITKKYDIKLKFDALSNTTQNFKAASFYDDGYSLDLTAILDYKTDPSFIISPYRGNPIPNLISVKINKQELCNNGVYKNVWTEFLNVTDEPIAPVNSVLEAKVVEILPECGRRPIQNRPFIEQGWSSKPGDWPWHSALYRLQTSSSQLKYTCGGTLISITRVLTAGHCVVEYGSILLPERLFVALGKFNFIGDDNGLQEKRVFEIILHPKFSRNKVSNDIAVLKLSSEVTLTEFVQPICINANNPDKSQLADTFGYVVGWGKTEKAKHSDHLLEARVPIKSDLECLKEDPSFFDIFLNDGNFCVGYENGTGVCNGDSGGGLYLSQNNSEGQEMWFLRGIVSLGAALHDQTICNTKHFTLFTDVAHYIDFIEKHV